MRINKTIIVNNILMSVNRFKILNISLFITNSVCVFLKIIYQCSINSEHVVRQYEQSGGRPLGAVDLI